MPKLPCVSGAKVAKALERLGFTRRRQRGSHLVMRRGSDVCVAPMHREVDQGTFAGCVASSRRVPERVRGKPLSTPGSSRHP